MKCPSCGNTNLLKTFFSMDNNGEVPLSNTVDVYLCLNCRHFQFISAKLANKYDEPITCVRDTENKRKSVRPKFDELQNPITEQKKSKNFGEKDWKKYIPIPVCENHPEYEEFYLKAWELAHNHVKYIDGMPQNPYMDEAFCETQVWIWDTCFMTLFCKFAQEVFPGVETFENFYTVLNENKLLPAVIVPKNEPGWTGAIPGRKKHIDVHIADNPPLFAWAEYENALIHGDKEYLKNLLYEKKSLQKHYDWFENLKASASIFGVRYPTHLETCGDGYKWEGGASGMDNTPRGRLGEQAEKVRPNNPNMLWVDAICQQALTALSISNLFNLIEDKNNATTWRKKYQEKKEIINRLYWDEDDKFYYDIDSDDKHFYKVQTIASYWALTAEIADNRQAKALLEKVLDDLCFGGGNAIGFSFSFG